MSGADADWYQAGTTTPSMNINNDIYTYGQVGVGMDTPTVALQVSGNVIFGDTGNSIDSISTLSSILGGTTNTITSSPNTSIV